jgi:hypothetical protein
VGQAVERLYFRIILRSSAPNRGGVVPWETLAETAFCFCIEENTERPGNSPSHTKARLQSKRSYSQNDLGVFLGFTLSTIRRIIKAVAQQKLKI